MRTTSSRIRILAILLALALGAAACSQSASTDTATDDPAGDASSPTATATAADGAEPESTDTPEAEPEPSDTSADTATVEPEDSAPVVTEPAPVGADTPGVTDDAITVSFIITDVSAVAQGFGWELPDEGDRVAQVEALVAHANANGGVGGRMIDGKIHVFNAITDGPVAEEALCNAITQDDNAFAVFLTGQLQENARPCYAAANTMMFDATLYPTDVAGFESLAPYLWSPFLPSYDDLVAGLAAGLLEQGWFEGGTLGVIAIDSDLSQRVYEEQFLPRIKAAGVEVASYNTIDPTDGTSFNNDQLQAIVNFKEAGVDKVVAIGGSRLVSWFIDTSLTQSFAPAYAVTSYDSPEFNIFNYPEMMPGSSGISVWPGFDVNDAQLAFPHNDAEQECIDIFTNAGLDVGNRASIRTGLAFCDGVRLLQAVGGDLTEVSAQGVSEAVWRLGSSFTPASVYGVEFSEGQYTGGDLFQRFAFDEGCQCMAIQGTPLDFDG